MPKRSFSVFALSAAALVVLGAAPATASGETPDAKAPKKKDQVCKKIEVTGSLVKVKKVCLTRDQWNRSAEDHEKFARDLTDGLRTRPGGN
jgi:hypothetical protein